MDETAVVTGAAGGIGRAVAERLAGEGYRVVVVDVADGSDTVAAIRDAGGAAEYREGDVTDEASLRDAFDGLAVDALVNNAAVYAPLVENKRRFDELSDEEFADVLDVNVTGVFRATKAALPAFTEGARVVNVASNTVELGVPGFLHYVASKGAVVSMTRALATELGELGVRANVAMPGLTMSEATLQNDESYIEAVVEGQAIERRLEPEDVANAVAFLAGEESAPMTGQVLNVDPGQAFY